MMPFQQRLTQAYNEAAAKYEEELRQFTKFCNEQRCPLCGSQLDGKIGKNQASLYCVGNNEEYSVVFIPQMKEPTLERITYWYPQYQYTIVWTFASARSNTIIERYNMDADPKFRYKTRKVVFELFGDRLPFFRSRMEEDVFLRKLKTYQVFG